MNKNTWQKHIEEVRASGFALGHSINECPICSARKKTVLASIARKERDQMMKDCGLVKVRGAVSGKVYWE